MFLFLVFVLCFLISREFSNERGRVERRAQFVKERARAMFNADFNAYLNWITEAGLLNTDDMCSSKARKKNVVKDSLNNVEEAQILNRNHFIKLMYKANVVYASETRDLYVLGFVMTLSR